MKYDVKNSVYISEIEERIANGKVSVIMKHEGRFLLKTDPPLPLTLSSTWNRKQGRRALRQTLVPLGLLGIKRVGQMRRYGTRTHHKVTLDFRLLSHGLHQNCFKKKLSHQEKTKKVGTNKLYVA
jgi:hypothetical protein